MISLQADALGYVDRGFSVVPVMGKKPTTRSWKRYTATPATSDQVRRWFASSRPNGIAVICGPVSGDLVIRDFDEPESYDRWRIEQPDLADLLPTVQTTRGFHVYMRHDNDKIKHLGGGELRGNGICLMPHSNPQGFEYQWLVPLPDGPLPWVDPFSVGLANGIPNPTEQTEHTEHTEAMVCSCQNEKNFALDGAIAIAIASTLPKRPGRRNHQIWQLARSLKAIYPTAEARELKPTLKEWHRLALPVITTKPLEESWLDFVTAWNNVRYPRGQEPIMHLLEQVEVFDMPDAAQDYEQPELYRLIAICRELQRLAGDGPFYLGCRTAGQLLNVRHDRAARWLKLLVFDEILREVEKGGQPGTAYKATRYRYIAGRSD